MLKTGKIYGLAPRENYFDGRLTLVHPLLLLDKTTITQACRQWALPVWENACPSKDRTARSETLQRALDLCGGDMTSSGTTHEPFDASPPGATSRF